jgi:hypothetical protein
MDRSVLAALAKWPNVPDVFGWLSLTARGEWRIRGEPIGNAAIRAFVSRNYASDNKGRWYFQNGPQRVFVTLDAMPWVIRVSNGLSTHTGVPVHACTAAVLLDDGRIVLQTDLGAGIVDDRDNPLLLPTMHELSLLDVSALGCAGGRLVLQRESLERCAERFGVVQVPEPD